MQTTRKTIAWSGVVLATFGLWFLPGQVAGADEPLPSIHERIQQPGNAEVPDFRQHVVPLLGRLGCNGRACHGSFKGQGGLRLSLFGYDFPLDHKSLTGGEEPRVDLDEVAESLMLQKPTTAIPHEGGQRMKADSWEYELLSRWIASGAKGLAADQPDLVELLVTPREIVFDKAGETVPLKVSAVWADGTTEDVTELTRFRTNNEQVALIDEDGLVTGHDQGDTHVVAFFDNGVVPVPVILPVSDSAGSNYPQLAATTEIDRHVLAKLRKLGIIPSDVAGDAEFLRRVSLDLTGTLPAPSEVEAFLVDSSPDKRRAKIDELLERPAYAAWWATRLCDITGNSEESLRNVTPSRNRNTAVDNWYSWIHKRVAENMPYDELAAGIVLATGRQGNENYTEYSALMSSISHGESQFADRETMPHYWARRNVRQPAEKALSFAHSFLGIRIQCAQCHKHPFDQWTQDDYKQFTNFFSRIQFGITRADKKEQQAMIEELELGDKKGGILRRGLANALDEGKTVPFQEVYVIKPEPEAKPKPKAKSKRKANPKKKRKKKPTAKSKKAKPTKNATNKKNTPKSNRKNAADAKQDTQTVTAEKPTAKPKPKAKPKKKKKKRRNQRRPPSARILGGEVIRIDKLDDPRVALMDWLRDADNPYFARAFVNRVWAVYFNVGIVEPPDDLSLANPPSNEALLDYLAQAFISHNYDLKWLHREIANSQTYQRGWRPNKTNRLDKHNFSRSVPRRLPAEVALDAIVQATASDAAIEASAVSTKGRAISIPGTGQGRRKGGKNYALTIFGKSLRESNCDCDRSTEPSLLQTIYLRNDRESLAMLDRPKDGWLSQVVKKYQPSANRPRPKQEQQSKTKELAKAGDAERVDQTDEPTGGAGTEDAKSTGTKTSPKKSGAKAESGKPAPAKKPAKPRLSDAKLKQQIEKLNKRLAKLTQAGNKKKAKAVKRRMENAKKQLKRRRVAADTKQKANKRKQKNKAGAPVRRLKPVQIAEAELPELVRQAYLRTLSRYPEDDELKRSLTFIGESTDSIAGLRGLMWALINTKEFIVNH